MNRGKTFLDTDLATAAARRMGTLRRRKNWPGPLYWTRNGWRRNLAYLTSQLSAIVRCNAPLVAGLEKAIPDCPSLKLTQAMLALSDDLSSGMRLADAMAECPRFYPAWYVDLVRAGESTGTLEQALSAAGEQLAAMERFNRTARGWIAYIGAVFMVQMVIAFFLFEYIIPEFIQLYADFGAQLPYVVRIVDRVLGFISVMHIRIVFLVCALSIVWWCARRVAGERRVRFSRLFAPALAPLPVVGKISALRDLASVCSVLEPLAAANVPINEALRDCAAMDIAGAFQRAFLRAAVRVEQGQNLGDALRSERVFPSSFVTMISLGDASGKLDDAARHLRTLYEEQAIRRIRMAFDIAGPIGVLGLGAVSLAIYGGIFTSLISISEILINAI